MCREHRISFAVGRIVFENTTLIQIGIHILGYAPLGVEEVKQVLYVEAELKSICGLASFDLEVVLVAEVNSVNPWRVNAISFCVLALVLAEILVIMDIIHEAVAIVV